MTDQLVGIAGQIGRVFALPFTFWMEPATRNLFPMLPMLGQPVFRAGFWGGVGWFGLQYFKPNVANIYNGESPGKWKLVDIQDPDATYIPPWLIASWMAYVAYDFI